MPCTFNTASMSSRLYRWLPSKRWLAQVSLAGEQASKKDGGGGGGKLGGGG